MGKVKLAVSDSVMGRSRAAWPVCMVVAMTVGAWACHESPTQPPAPSSEEIASTGLLDKKGGNGNGGGSGQDDPVLYDVVGTGAFEFSGTMQVGSDNKRTFSMDGEGISLKLRFSSATVNEENCYWTEGYDWDDPEIVAVRESLTTYDAVADIDFAFFPRNGRARIRRVGPWTMYCTEEDGTSGGCDTTETIMGDGTRVYEMNGSTTSPTRWVKLVGGNYHPVGILCMDQETAPTVTLTATPRS